MTVKINEVDKVEILTIQDNYIDVLAMDSSEVIKRALPIDFKTMKPTTSILAEHGFASMVTVTKGGRSRSILFDFGYSPHGATANAEALNVDFNTVEAAILSHGHLDHFGGLSELIKKTGKQGLEMILHPEAFRGPRFAKFSESFKVNFEPFTREQVRESGLKLVETKNPYPLLDGDLLFLGEIPRVTDFEKGMRIAHYMDNGEEKWDNIPDDSAVVANVKGKGLVVLSGCSHAGIINTAMQAKAISDVDKLYAIMGGFHLTGPEMEPVIEPTVRELKNLDPTYIIPAHCTGRKATLFIEREMADRFLLNMAGTKMVFEAGI